MSVEFRYFKASKSCYSDFQIIKMRSKDHQNEYMLGKYMYKTSVQQKAFYISTDMPPFLQGCDIDLWVQVNKVKNFI